MQTRVMDRLADRMDEVREFLSETDNDLLAAEYISKLVHDIENELVIEDMEMKIDLDGKYLYGC